MKKLNSFFPLRPVPFYGQDYEKQKSLEVVTSLFLSCKTFLLKKNDHNS